MTVKPFYPIGTPGKPWTAAEKQQWRESQTRFRSYETDVLETIKKLEPRYDVSQYGELHYGDRTFPLMAVKTQNWDDSLPVALITGGVHGYETSGVMGALSFLSEYQNEYAGKINLLVVPCVSPWAYEHITRWTYDAVDTNRQFYPQGEGEEARALMALAAPLKGKFLLHVDLHETTDSDESEFRPAKAARDGETFEPGTIPDGYYLVSDTQNSRLDFQAAIIAAVEKVTHIAPADKNGNMLDYPVVSHGVVEYDNNAYHLCATLTGAPFTTTTEVYPDSPDTTPEACTRAQVVTVHTAIEFALAHA
ncbi:M14 family metallocarboxypeptidase [Lelliottia sp. V89_10]|uniref:M14 family metallopeptidase n=1 Tax=Lelliottia wanjuensis TaxID=3050585 RepID=UPI00249E9A05|nr:MULTISPECIES: M14 family metallocarboxypeptidase [unclassified Lelliottia]MDI3361332.1 M14 family metallocarboxypeptidase [Lelliottia sp. V89_13]MDK9549917.1 M14 family metallocarboxypeptidase [Lelliottia sp. V89_5]MDK9595916.1 M14 family metallocarboxypeptidase [Lelliottia sp. V89_10]